jgi:UDP-glucose 4-epimerase
MAIRRGDVLNLMADPTLAEEEFGFRVNKDLTTMSHDLWDLQSPWRVNRDPCDVLPQQCHHGDIPSNYIRI